MIMRIDPFRELDKIATTLSSEFRYGFTPLDIYKEGDEYILEFDLPGADPNSIDLKIENGVLTLQATRHNFRGDSVEVLSSERFQGKYRRSVHLGSALDSSAVKATYNAGVLKLRIPLAEAAKPRKISVNFSSEQGEVELPGH